MEHPDKARLIHHYDRKHARILCGLEDWTAHWTTRRTVNCPRCNELLRADERPPERGSLHAADAP